MKCFLLNFVRSVKQKLILVFLIHKTRGRRIPQFPAQSKAIYFQKRFINTVNVSTLVLGKTEYKSKDRVNLTLAVTFAENINPKDIYLSVEKEHAHPNSEVKIHGVLKDAKDADESKLNSSPSQCHLHFELTNLQCGSKYTYELKSQKGEKLNVLAAFDEKVDRKLRRFTFKAPPAKDSKQNIRMVVSGDQEAVELNRKFKLGNDVATAILAELGHPLDQRLLVTQLYRELENRRADLFLHLGDVFHGEQLVGRTFVESLDEYREHLNEDFHQVVRDSIGGMVSFCAKDDHDLGHDGVNAEMVAIDPIPFDNSHLAFNEFWPVPTSAEDHHRGLYYQTDYGDISIWFLHNRRYATELSLLGDEQTKWLEKTLAKSTAPIKIICTPLPYVMGKNPKEDYRKNPEEWAENIRLFAKHDVTAIFSADTHNFSASRIIVNSQNKQVEIPHFVVGMLGGIPQMVSDEEAQMLPQPLLPPIEGNSITGIVDAYYTPIVDAGVIFLPLPFMGKRNRAFLNGEWVGEKYQRASFGFMDVSFDFHSNKMNTSLFLTHLGAKTKPYFHYSSSHPF